MGWIMNTLLSLLRIFVFGSLWQNYRHVLLGFIQYFNSDKISYIMISCTFMWEKDVKCPINVFPQLLFHKKYLFGYFIYCNPPGGMLLYFQAVLYLVAYQLIYLALLPSLVGPWPQHSTNHANAPCFEFKWLESFSFKPTNQLTSLTTSLTNKDISGSTVLYQTLLWCLVMTRHCHAARCFPPVCPKIYYCS